MFFGVIMFCTEYTIRIDDLARELESRGFESLCVPEHTHIPTSRRSPWPGGAVLPREYLHTLDPFVGLAAAAVVTERLRLLTGIALLAERDPIICAKECASLDYLSNGRFELGIGAGWNAEEMENHGTVFKHRFKIMADRAKAMRAIWTMDQAEYHGQFTDFGPLWSYPKPTQPRLPILLGGETRHTLRRVVEFGDGWMPRGRSFGNPKAEMARLRQAAFDGERDPATIKVSLFGGRLDDAAIATYREAGIDRCLFILPPKGRDEILPLLDEMARFTAA